MERRAFLKLGGLTTLGAAAPDLAAAAPPVIDEATVAEALRNMEAGAEAIRARLGRRAANEAVLGHSPEMLEAMRTLVSGMYVYQAFTEQPLEVQVHPDVQHRVLQACRDLDTGAETLSALLANATEAERAALDRVWDGSDGSGVLSVEQQYAFVGATVHGRRRFHRMADFVARDVRRRGTHGALSDYLDEIRGNKAQRARRRPEPPVGERRRVEHAVAYWEARGVQAGVPARVAESGSAEFGVLLIILGAIGIVLGLASMGCLCIGLPVLLLGLLLLILGIVMLANAQRDQDGGEVAVPGGALPALGP